MAFHNSQLNDAQKKAVSHLYGPLLVLAGAGSGKTRVVTSRIVYLLEQGVDPSRILAITFTNKAAEEMRRRLQQSVRDPILVSTFHSLGAKILREMSASGYLPADFTIYDDDDREKAIKKILEDCHIKDKEINPKSVKELISDAKNKMLSESEWANHDVDSKLHERFSFLYKKYQEFLKAANAVDFDDLLYLPVKMLKENATLREYYQERWPFVLIDEYQDTNEAQYQLTQLLVSKTRNLFVVGDPDQSIYSWRGANIRNILDFERDYPDAEIVRLEQNYRSSMIILKAANALISQNKNRLPKSLWSEKLGKEKITVFQGNNEWDEGRFVVDHLTKLHEENEIPYEEMAIFYRTNSQSRIFEDILIEKQIPYRVIGGLSFYQRREIKDILAFLKVIHSGKDPLSFSRSVYLPKRGIGPSTVDKIIQGSRGRDVITWLVEGNDEIRLTKMQKTGLDQYIDLVVKLRAYCKTHSLSELISHLISTSGYLQHLELEKETAEDRKANLDELVVKASEWESKQIIQDDYLGKFLEELSLITQIDEYGDKSHCVNLMTLHHGKGLEFEGVFLVGMEETLFPHVRSLRDPQALEEERRLCYVGLTRAKQHLYLSSCRSRFLWGGHHNMIASRFLKELPQELLVKPQTAFSFERKKEVRLETKPSFYQEETKELASAFKVGDRVFHPLFGKGAIQAIRTGSLGVMYDIFFDKETEKKTLLEKYAKLKACP